MHFTGVCTPRKFSYFSLRGYIEKNCVFIPKKLILLVKNKQFLGLVFYIQKKYVSIPTLLIKMRVFLVAFFLHRNFYQNPSSFPFEIIRFGV